MGTTRTMRFKLSTDVDGFLGRQCTNDSCKKYFKIKPGTGLTQQTQAFCPYCGHPDEPGDFLTDDQKALRWDRVIIAGSSHGSTTAARFAKHQRVDRVVMFCGPRDQHETWQALPSATPENRFFGFSHVLDDGWKGDHYCRSWEMLGLHEFGPLVNVDQNSPPYGHTRRLITDADVKNDATRAHGCVVPGGSAVKDASGKFVHEEVWRYLFTHPVEAVGSPVPHDSGCEMDLRATSKRPARSKQ